MEIKYNVEYYKNKIKQLDKEWNKTQRQLNIAYQRSFISCSACKKKTKVGNTKYYKHHWYDENTGSPNGGFWQYGYSYWECKCGYKNKIKQDTGLCSTHFAYEENVYKENNY